MGATAGVGVFVFAGGSAFAGVVMGVGVAGAMLGAAGVVGATLGVVDIVRAADVVGVAAVGDTLTGAGPPLQPATSAAANSANPIVYIARIRFVIPFRQNPTARRLSEWLCRPRAPVLGHPAVDAVSASSVISRYTNARHNLPHRSERLAPHYI